MISRPFIHTPLREMVGEESQALFCANISWTIFIIQRLPQDAISSGRFRYLESVDFDIAKRVGFLEVSR